MESISELMVLLLGIVTSFAMVALRKMATFLDSVPSTVRSVIVVALSLPVAMLGGALGLELPADPTTWDGTTVNTVLTAVAAMGAHAGAKAFEKSAM